VSRRAALTVLLALGAAAIAAPASSAATREYWVAAVPATWNAVPNGRDGITGTRFDPSETVFPTVVYRRYTRGWRRPDPQRAAGSGNQDLIPGPLLRARVGTGSSCTSRTSTPSPGDRTPCTSTG
jgi:hypothetical protein